MVCGLATSVLNLVISALRFSIISALGSVVSVVSVVVAASISTSVSSVVVYPEFKFKSIHVAGTNGKGSTSSMIASILQEAGYKVGLYTSPHLKDFRERIRINGEMISEDAVVDNTENIRNILNKIDEQLGCDNE